MILYTDTESGKVVQESIKVRETPCIHGIGMKVTKRCLVSVYRALRNKAYQKVTLMPISRNKSAKKYPRSNSRCGPATHGVIAHPVSRGVYEVQSLVPLRYLQITSY